jgi:TolB protein
MYAAWSADGRRLAFSARSATRQDANHYPLTDLVVVDTERGCSRLLSTTGTDWLSMPSWSPDGARLAYLRSVTAGAPANRALEIVTDDGGGKVTRVAEGTLLGGTWAPDGSGRLAFGQDGGLRVRNPDGTVVVLDATTGGAEDESWSPDATKVVYTISVHQGIWVAAADGSGYRDLSPKDATNPNGIFWSRFSPDGRRIAFVPRTDLWVIDADGTNPRRVLAGTGHGPGGAWWTPAGDGLVYNADDGVRVVPVEGGESRLLHAGKAFTVLASG